MKEIKIRRSIRNFKNKPVSHEKIEMLLRAAMQAPSAGNQKPWYFVVTEDRNRMRELKIAKGLYADLLDTATLAIVFVARFDGKYPQFVTQDIGAAIQNLLLEAVNLDLGSCWIGVYPNEEEVERLNKTLNLDDGYQTMAIVGIGYPDSQVNKFIDRFDETRIKRDYWS